MTSHTSPHPTDVGPAKRGRVLVVDDSPAVRLALARRMREAGLEVEEAADGPSAMVCAFANPPRVVVTDLWMPGMSGLQLCRLLGAAEATAGAHVLLLTSADDPRTRFWARRSGATAFFAKHELTAMMETVEQLMLGPARDAPTVTPLRSCSGSAQEQLCVLLDEALCESVIVAEVRDLAHAGETMEELFVALAALMVQLFRYRFLVFEAGGRRFAQSAPGARGDVERRIGSAGAGSAGSAGSAGAAGVEWFEEPRLDESLTSVERLELRFANRFVGSLVVGGNFTLADRRMLEIIARELGGPVRVIGLIAESLKSATTDSLTGLLNRRAFTDAMTREIISCERDARPLSILILDVDHFKRINDERGHAAGDDALRKLARLLRGTLRRSDLAARWGGEEFVVALPTTSVAGAAMVAERLRRAIHALMGDFTVSIGHSTAGRGDTLQLLLARADQALYRAKDLGRNRVEGG